MKEEILHWEQINSAHVLLVLRPVCFCHSRRECRISACCWRDSQKFMHQQASHIVLQPMYAPTPQKKKKYPCCLEFGCLLSPISNPLTHTELAGGLAFVYSCLYSHSPGYTVMFSSVIWRTPLFSSCLGNSG